MFGKTKNLNTTNGLITLDIHTTSPGDDQPSIIRNDTDNSDKKRLWISFYDRADQIFLRSRIYESGNGSTLLN